MSNWLNKAVAYQIYPQSFYDTNGDGIGDLQGIIAKLDYIQSCGFDVIWLNPINKSSFRDAGYDVTDFYSVDPRYGTNADFKALCNAAHSRGMKVIFDLVAGHTSIDHPWFIESGKVEKNQYTNRYIWTTPAFCGGEGISSLGQREEKCINNFFWSQPALNYGYAHPDPEKPWQLPVTHPDCIATKEELKNIIRFWMELGTDAFRVDMAASLIKGDTDGSFMRAFWHEIRAFMADINPDSLLIAEWGFPYRAISAGFHLDFFLASGTDAYTSLFRSEKGCNTQYDYIGHSYFRKEGKGNINTFLDHYFHDLDIIGTKGYIGMISGNHDMPRLAYRRTPEEVKAAMAFLFTMKGVPFVYYGDEIGMDYIEGLPSKEGGYVRTGARTPMQWNSEKNHGFSPSDTPYLPTDSRPNAPTVAAQDKDEASVLNLVRRLAALHKTHPALEADAAIEVLSAGYPFVYTRSAGEKKLLIAINPAEEPRLYRLPAFSKVLLSQNVELGSDYQTLGSVSFLIAEV